MPWISLARTPTPVRRVSVAEHGELWVKQDDLSGSAYGGNKVRKLEFLLADALRTGARRVITVGAAGSHHALATALYSRMHGISATLVLFPQRLTPHIRDVLLADAALGAELRWAPRMEAIPAAALLARFAYRGERPYTIPAGGSNALGVLGYVNAALELEDQVAAGLLPEPEVIHVAAGTLGTAAGLALGLSLGGLNTRIHAIRIASPLVSNQRNLRRLVNGAMQILSGGGLVLPALDRILARIELSHDAIGAGYGELTAAGMEAERLLSAVDLQLDGTYTAKAAGAMLARLTTARGPHLFWHTLSANAPALRDGAADEAALPRSFRRYLRGSATHPNRS